MPPSLPERIATRAESIVNTFTETRYTHIENIDAGAGVYDCDCSEFVGYVLEQVAPDLYMPIAATAAPPRPLAFDFFTFFANLTPESASGWGRVDVLLDARRGDVVAWRAPEIEPKHNTGHCFFIADTPKVLDSGDIAARVYDSAAAPHFEDTRSDGPASAAGSSTSKSTAKAGRSPFNSARARTSIASFPGRSRSGARKGCLDNAGLSIRWLARAIENPSWRHLSLREGPTKML